VDGEVLADMPAASLEEDAPRYDRPRAEPADRGARLADDPSRLPAPADCGADLLSLLGDAAWAYRQYDHQLFLNTVEGPGGDAAVLRLKAPGLPPSTKALALTTDGNHRWCALDPRAGTAMVVAEATLNVACAGARPVAVVNCLNFGNPEHPEVMWQLSEAIDGMGDACRALGVPVIGGNVSLYNESLGRDIDPTPVVGVLGLIDHLERRPPGLRLVDGDAVVLLGAGGRRELAGSRWAWEVHGHRGGTLPDLDLDAHRSLLALVCALVTDGIVDGVHDVADGGLGAALAEMAAASDVGARVDGIADHAELFSEAPSRVLACVPPDGVERVRAAAEKEGVALTVVGRAGGDRLVVDGLVDVAVSDVAEAWRTAVPVALGEI